MRFVNKAKVTVVHMRRKYLGGLAVWGRTVDGQVTYFHLELFTDRSVDGQKVD